MNQQVVRMNYSKPQSATYLSMWPLWNFVSSALLLQSSAANTQLCSRISERKVKVFCKFMESDIAVFLMRFRWVWTHIAPPSNGRPLRSSFVHVKVNQNENPSGTGCRSTVTCPLSFWLGGQAGDRWSKIFISLLMGIFKFPMDECEIKNYETYDSAFRGVWKTASKIPHENKSPKYPTKIKSCVCTLIAVFYRYKS